MRTAPVRTLLLATCIGSATACGPTTDGPSDVGAATHDATADTAAQDVVARDGASDAGIANDGATTPDGSARDGATRADATDGGTGMLGNFPARFAAPYVETWNDNNLATIAHATGHRYFTLAFVINGGGSCNPQWNGYESLTANHYGAYITALRAMGGDVIVSFGGSAGTELGNACSTVASLQAAYQRVITQFGLTWIDLDIESGAESDTPSVDRRNKAMHALQMANPGLRVSYTLAVARDGLPRAQRALLRNAVSNGVRVESVNVMAMDYGPCYTDMGQAAIDAADATRDQLATDGVTASVGVTPMLGQNDVHCETFSATNSQQLVDYAQAHPYIETLGFWAYGADHGQANTVIFHTFH